MSVMRQLQLSIVAAEPTLVPGQGEGTALTWDNAGLGYGRRTLRVPFPPAGQLCPSEPGRLSGGLFFMLRAVVRLAGATPRPRPVRRSGDGVFSLIQPERGAPQVHVLGELASAGTISVACSQAVRLVRIVLDYRVRCKEIELRREQLGLTPGSQPALAATGRHATRRRRHR